MSGGIVPVVEGRGELDAVPLLLRRILHEILKVFNVPVLKPWQVRRNQVVRPGKLERTIEAVLRKRLHVGAILVLLDADDDCPAKLGPSLVSRAESVCGKPVSGVVANKEFEAWFLGAIDSLGPGHDVLPDSARERAPEAVRGAKGLLQRLLGPYDPVKDQAKLSAKMDLDLCRERCPSFDKLCRDVARIAETIR